MARMRAVSPVVATALLVLIAVATAVLLYLWVSGTVAAQPTQQKSLQEQLKVDALSVYYNTSAQKYNVTAYIRNTGAVPANITRVYVIYNNTIIATGIPTTPDKASVYIAPGQVLLANFTFKTDKSLVGRAVIVKFVTSDGVELQAVGVVSKQ